jgi:hypothetical protein
MAHRAEAQKLSGITEKQRAGLALGSVKGTNHREGHVKSETTKLKIAEANIGLTIPPSLLPEANRCAEKTTINGKVA